MLTLKFFILEYVRDMDHGPIADGAEGGEGAARSGRIHGPEPVRARSIGMDGGQMNPLAIEPCHVADLGTTQPDGAVHDRIEDRLNIGGGPADDAQDFAGRRLLFQRIGQLCVARLQFREQKHVLDGDHRLRGECPQQLDLLDGERPRLGASDGDRPDGVPFAKHRDHQNASIA